MGELTHCLLYLPLTRLGLVRPPWTVTLPFSLSTRAAMTLLSFPLWFVDDQRRFSLSSPSPATSPSTGRPLQLSSPSTQPVYFAKPSTKRTYSPSRARKQRDSSSPWPREGLPLRDLLRLSFSLTKSCPLLNHYGLKRVGQGFLSLFLDCFCFFLQLLDFLLSFLSSFFLLLPTFSSFSSFFFFFLFSGWLTDFGGSFL